MYFIITTLLPRRGLLCTSRDKPWMGQLKDVRASDVCSMFVCLSRSDRDKRLVGYLEQLLDMSLCRVGQPRPGVCSPEGATLPRGCNLVRNSPVWNPSACLGPPFRKVGNHITVSRCDHRRLYNFGARCVRAEVVLFWAFLGVFRWV